MAGFGVCTGVVDDGQGRPRPNAQGRPGRRAWGCAGGLWAQGPGLCAEAPQRGAGHAAGPGHQGAGGGCSEGVGSAAPARLPDSRATASRVSFLLPLQKISQSDFLERRDGKLEGIKDEVDNFLPPRPEHYVQVAGGDFIIGDAHGGECRKLYLAGTNK